LLSVTSEPKAHCLMALRLSGLRKTKLGPCHVGQGKAATRQMLRIPISGDFSPQIRYLV
jgi:hypothetical protein